MVKSDYPDEEEFSASDSKSIEEEEGVDGLEGWRTVSIRDTFRTKSAEAGQLRRNYQDPLLIDSDVGGKDCGISSSISSTNSSSAEPMLLFHEQTSGRLANGADLGQEDKRLRRQIANSNERRRMQSINQGFQTLRLLLPCKKDGDKMSKAAILAATAEYIHALQLEKNHLEQVVQRNEDVLLAAKRQRLDRPQEDPMDVGCELSCVSSSNQLTAPSIQSTIVECLRTIEELQATLCREQQRRLLLEQEKAALLTICQKQVSPYDGLGEISTAVQSPSSCQQQQQSPHLITSLTSAFSALRDVFGSKVGSNGDTAGRQLPAPIPNRPLLEQPANSWMHNGSQEVVLEDSTSGLIVGGHTSNQLLATVQHMKEVSGNMQTVLGNALPRNDCRTGTGATLSQRNLQAILEAIRHIEGENQPN